MVHKKKPNIWLVVIALVLIGCGGGGGGGEGATAPGNGGGGNETPGVPAVEPASTEFESDGSGYSAYSEAWNCAGLEGVWQLQSEITIAGYGTIQTAGPVTFVMPPRPDTGAWDSLPFSYIMSGTLHPAPGFRADITYEMFDIVNTIIVMEDGPTLMDSRGSATGTVTVTGPDVSFTESATYENMLADAPNLIVFGPHPGCD